MRKMWTVAAREYKATVRTKSFVISLLLMPVLMGGQFVFQAVLKNQGNTKEKRFAVVDRSGGDLFPILEAAARQRNETQIFDPETGKQIKSTYALERVAPSTPGPDEMNRQRLELSDRVRQKDLFGFVEIGPDVYPDPGTASAQTPAAPDRILIRYQSNSPLYNDFHQWAGKVLNDAIHDGRTVKAGLSPTVVHALVRPVPLAAKELSRLNPETGAIEDGRDVNFLLSFFVPFGLIMMMFMIIMIGAGPLLMGILEEKMQRIAEVLLGSIQPFDLMMGKLVGTVAVSLTLVAVYLGGAWWAGQRYGFAEAISPEVIFWFVIFQTMAVLMFGSLYIAAGAAAGDVKEAQTLLLPVTIMICLPLFSLTHVIQEPNSTFTTGLSFFPPATPMLMIARMAVPPGIPTWQPVLGVGLMFLTTVACVYAAGRIFRVGILMQGKGARFGDMMKWVIRG